MGTKQTMGESKKRLNTSTFIGITILAGVVIIGGAVLIGKSDSGAINVTNTIKNSNQTHADTQQNVETTSDPLKNMPNGGLVPKDDQSTPPPEAAPPATEDATTSTTTETNPEAPPVQESGSTN